MIIKDIQFIKGATRWEHLPEDGLPEVAFVGRSNVGKSSLLNMLAGRVKLARISRTPGKTQEFNYYRVNNRLYFVDLPGYGSVIIWCEQFGVLISPAKLSFRD